jgi:hypothetical protein
VRALAFFGGCTELWLPDNLRSGVSKASRYEPDVNSTYHDLAEHHGVAVMPARARRSKDEVKVESGVLVLPKWGWRARVISASSVSTNLLLAKQPPDKNRAGCHSYPLAVGLLRPLQTVQFAVEWVSSLARNTHPEACEAHWRGNSSTLRKHFTRLQRSRRCVSGGARSRRTRGSVAHAG